MKAKLGETRTRLVILEKRLTSKAAGPGVWIIQAGKYDDDDDD